MATRNSGTMEISIHRQFYSTVHKIYTLFALYVVSVCHRHIQTLAVYQEFITLSLSCSIKIIMCGIAKSIILQAVVVLLLDRVVFIEGFQPLIRLPSTSREIQHGRSPRNVVASDHQPQSQYIVALSNVRNDDSNCAERGDAHSAQSRRTIRTMLHSALTSISRSVTFTRKNLRFVVAVTIAASTLSGNSRFMKIESCSASAPVMAIPKAEGRDPITEALEVHQRKKAAAAQKELNEMAATARKIEAEQGEMARIKYEKEYKDAQMARAQSKLVEVEQLKRKLLDEGICPFTDMEGQRQVIELQQGIDLGKVQGTPLYLEKEWEVKNPARSMKVKKAMNRRVVACMVQDMKNRDIDPLEYFQKHQDQTEVILDMKPELAMRLVQQYEMNLEEYGQITKPKEGEMSVKEKLALTKTTDVAGTRAADKAAAKAKADELRRISKEEKMKEQAAAKAAKDAAKADANRLKQQAKAEATAAAAAATAAAMAAATAATDAAMSSAESILSSADSSIQQQASPGSTTSGINEAATDDSDSSVTTITKAVTPSSESSSLLSMAPKAVGAIAIVGGGGYAFTVQRKNAAIAEEERRRQFQLLMEGSTTTTKPKSSITPNTAPALEVILDNVPSKMEVPASPPVDTPKPKRLGIKSVFGKKKNDREVDLNTLLSTTKAPTFATTLAKLLTFGAPGRFRSTLALPGSLPMDTFDLSVAQEILITQQNVDNLSREESAEVFANVVNCMLIEIVDLAATALKEKDDKVKTDAINIVIDFMNHAASLYLSIADGVTIKPVTYCGDLSKSKLEDMYSIYASSSLMNAGEIPDDYDNRVALLQDVFEINEKKAQGLMMKAMQKNMAEMLKSGKGMEGMEEMMKGMGGGMPGLGGAGDGEGPSPEALKEMLVSLKELKDSGSIPAEEFELVKKQFQDSFGSSVDDIVREADAKQEELSTTDRELLSLMKSIMD